MKKSYVAIVMLALITGLLFVSCRTTSSFPSNFGSFTAQSITIDSFYGKDEYTIVGKISGESGYVYWDNDLFGYAGDSRKYGIIYEDGKTDVIPQIDNYSDAQKVAILNANYELLKAMQELDADIVLSPTYIVETKKSMTREGTQFKVSVTALAVSINRN